MKANIPNVHVLKVTFEAWTEHKPNRIKITSEHYRQTVYIPDGTSITVDACEVAENWLKSQGYNITGHAALSKHYYVFTDTFEPLKPGK